MDVKAMARSKRSHTKHHQPRKPHRPNTQSTPSSSSSSSKDPKVLKEEGERKKSSPGSSLPSNWDRYYDSDDDEGLFGSDSESAGGPAIDATKTDVVKPKSKGADFGFLISEAMSQSSGNFSSTFDDVLPGTRIYDFRSGENILSWTGSDNFLMEDEAAPSQEVPFLSLNLQTLAEELARIDLAQRLFIEEDILPPELRAPQKVERDNPMPVSASVDDLAFQYSSKVEERTESKEGCSLRSISVDTSNRTPLSFRLKGQLDDSVAAHESDSFRVLDPKESFKAIQKAEIEDKMPGFEAGAAETELDMLLDSFKETTFFGSSNADSNAPIAVIKQKNSATFNDSTHLDFNKSSLSASNMDNVIDELLRETSVGFAISHSTEVNADSAGKQLSLSSTQPGTKSKVMEDFDSWLDTI